MERAWGSILAGLLRPQVLEGKASCEGLVAAGATLAGLPPPPPPGGAAPSGVPEACPQKRLCLATPHTRKRKVESHQVGPEPQLNVVHDRGPHNGDLWRRQAAGQAAPQPGEGRQNTEQRKSSKATPNETNMYTKQKNT